MNENFCYAPWVHLYTNPDSRLLPCCLYMDDNIQFPNLNEVSLQDALNHPRMVELRKEFLAGKDPKGCFRCKAQSDIKMNSYRHKMNQFGEKSKIVLNPDGTVDYDIYNPKFLDIRFGNLCNLKCRTCSPTFSSSIAVEFNKMHNAKLQVFYSLNDNVIDEIFHKLDSVEHIYLAGGEPLIEENNYRLLKELIRRNLNPSLLYNTNLTNLHFKDENLIELWKHFSNITLTVSIDGYGEVNDYIRFGSSYNQIQNHIDQIKTALPNIRFNINTVASILSMGSIADLGKDLLRRNICIPDDIMFSICHHPEYLDPTVLPNELKMQATQKIINFVSALPNTSHYNPLVNKYEGLISYMNSKDNSHLLDDAISHLSAQDKFRNTDYSTILQI